VGSMQVELRGASAKKHQYTVALYLDDMRAREEEQIHQRTHLLLTRTDRANRWNLSLTKSAQGNHWLPECAKGRGSFPLRPPQINAY